MEPNNISNSSSLCNVCHQAILPSYYFCPNCGNNLNRVMLSTSIFSQVWIYFLSFILPMFAFIFIKKWHGIAYLKSGDKKTKNIGIIACIILAFSTILTIYLAYVFTQSMIKSSVDSINADFGV